MLLTPPPTEREAYIDAAAAPLVWASKRYFDPAKAAGAAGGASTGLLPRGCAAPAGRDLRQRRPHRAAAPTSSVPSLVIHGRDDTLITPTAARPTAEAIPGANLLLLADMGHDLPEPLWPIDRRRHDRPHRPTPSRRRGRTDHGRTTRRYQIIEIAGIGPGPFAAMLLADMGAEVIRVERAQSVRGPAPDEPAEGRLAARPAQHRHRPQAPRRRRPRCSTSSSTPTRSSRASAPA